MIDPEHNAKTVAKDDGDFTPDLIADVGVGLRRGILDQAFENRAQLAAITQSPLENEVKDGAVRDVIPAGLHRPSASSFSRAASNSADVIFSPSSIRFIRREISARHASFSNILSCR